MGRKKLKKTIAEKRAQQAKWRDRRNAVRRQRYAQDPKYREAVYLRNREHYRAQNGVEMRPIASDKEVRSLAVKREVIGEGNVHTNMLTIDYADMAQLLGGIHKFVLHRWHRSGRFPRGPYIAIENGNKKEVYSVDLAKRLLAVMREHHREKVYLMRDDNVTIKKLFAA